MIPVGKIRVLATRMEVQKLSRAAYTKGFKKGYNRAVMDANAVVHNNILSRPEITAAEIRKLKK